MHACSARTQPLAGNRRAALLTPGPPKPSPWQGIDVARPSYTRRRTSDPSQPHECCRERKSPYILIDSYTIVALELSFCFATITTTIAVTVTATATAIAAASVTVTVTATAAVTVNESHSVSHSNDAISRANAKE